MKKPCATCGLPKNANRSKSSQFSWRKDRNRYHNDCKACVAAKKRKQENTHQERVSNTEKEAIESDPHGHLAADIVAQAIRDLRAEKSDELLAFFAGRWFEELCDACGVSPEYVRKHIFSESA